MANHSQNTSKNTLTLANKEYIVISKKDYEQLREQAASKLIPMKKLSLTDGKKLANKLIENWAK